MDLIDKALRPLLGRFDRLDARTTAIERRLDKLQTAIGRIEARQLGFERPIDDGLLSRYEFSVFSQWGEDGIIQWLTRNVAFGPKVFVEFGVADYSEANTRFLCEHDNWTGLVLDGSRENIERVRRSDVCWRHNLRAVDAFITRDNINALISEQGITGDIGLLSIDIDGNDYWVWEAIDVVRPAIVIVEYNYRFGKEHAVTIPYTADFRRGKSYPIYYFGASLQALCVLAQRKGYSFVGCNSNGVNAFFVLKEKLPPNIRELTAGEGYVAGTFTETSDDRGLYVPASPQQETADIMQLPLIIVSQ